MGRDEVKPRRDRGEFYLPGVVIDTCKLLNHNREITLEIDAEADALLDSLLDEFDNERLTASSPFAISLKTRSYEKCERVAGVLAVFDNPVTPLITASHVRWSEMFIKYCDDEILKFTAGHLHGGKVQSDSAKIMELIARFINGSLKALNKNHAIILKAGNIPRSLILRYSHLSKMDFDNAINHLCDLESVTVVNFTILDSIYKTILPLKS